MVRKRKMNIYSEKLHSLNLPIKRVPKSFLIIPIILILLLVGFSLLSSSSFKVANLYILGDQDGESSILQDLESIKGRNIFLLRASEISNIIKGKYENVENVYIYKYMPGTVEVEIVQSLPALVFSSLQKTTLVKRDGSSLGDIQVLSELKLLDYEIKILNGEKDLNAQYIKDTFLSDLTVEQRKEFKWEEVKEEEKEQRYNNIKNEINEKISKYRNSVREFLKNSEYANLPFFFSYMPYEDNEDFFTSALEVSDGLKVRGLVAVDNTFPSEYTLIENLDSGKQILFSTKRSINDQFKDLDSIIFYGRFSSSRIIDLRSEKYSIIR